MAKFSEHLLPADVHVNRPTDDPPIGTLFPCLTHSKVYQFDGEDWVDWITFGSGNSGFQLVDLGVINPIELIDGPQTLITPPAGSLLWILPDPVGFGPLDYCPVNIAPESRIGVSVIQFPIFQWGLGVSFYENAFSIPADMFQLKGVMDGTPIKAVLQSGYNAYNIIEPLSPWQANHVYSEGVSLILGPDGHVWSQTAGGTSGATIPDFAAGPPSNPPTWLPLTPYNHGDLILAGNPPRIWSATSGVSGEQSPSFALPGNQYIDENILWTYVYPPDKIADGGVFWSDGGVFWFDEGPVPTTGYLHLFALTVGV